MTSALIVAETGLSGGQALALALGTAAIGAVATLVGTVLSPRLQLASARRQRLREERINAAHEFTTKCRQAKAGVDDAVAAPSREMADASAMWKAAPEADRRIGEADAALARVLLFFGPTSDTGRAAVDAMERLVSAGKDVHAAGQGWRSARDHAAAAEAALARFNALALEAIERS